MAEIDDVTLARARRGDRSALETLVACYQTRVEAVVSRMLVGHQSLIEDVAQDVFVKVLRELHRFDGSRGTALSTWIVTVATRTSVDQLRKLRVMSRHSGEPGDGEHAVDTGGMESGSFDPEHQASVRELGCKVERAMASLPVESRAALVLRAYCDFDYPEIAAALGIEEGTVKSRLNRAREALRGIRSGKEETHG